MPETVPITLVLPDGTEVTLQVGADETILDAAHAAGLILPYTCLRGWCVTCAGRVLDDTGDCLDQSASLRYFPQDAAAGFVLLCTGKPRRRCRIATHQAAALKAHRREHGLPAPQV